MAQLFYVDYKPHSIVVRDDVVTSTMRMNRVDRAEVPLRVIGLPVLAWNSGVLWDEANLYFTSRAASVLTCELDVSTIRFDALGLLRYARFLEEKNLAWFAFGESRADRPTNVYRGYLISLREKGDLAPSTASARMASVIKFYRWVKSQGLLSTDFPPFEDRVRRIRYQDKVGFDQTLTVYSTNLHIPNKQGGRGVRLEGGLKPVSTGVRDEILRLVSKHLSIEFQLILVIGFSSGMRLQSILDLKIETLDRALPGETPGGAFLRIGPSANPSVATKFGVNGNAFLPVIVLSQLREYARSVRRLERVGIAAPQDRNVLFLNRFGRRYGRKGADSSPSINKDMERLRKRAAEQNIDLTDFYFHCTRATFATHVASAGLSVPGMKPLAVLRRIKDLLLHKSESTSQKYIDYVHECKVQANFEKEYLNWLFGEVSQ